MLDPPASVSEELDYRCAPLCLTFVFLIRKSIQMFAPSLSAHV
jgi:hypothetical protein